MANPGTSIYQCRMRQGLTQAELAVSCGIPQSNLSNIEKGKRDLTVSTLIRIAAALEVKPASLLEGSETEKKFPLTRRNIEKIAASVLAPSLRVSGEIRKFSGLFRRLLPETPPRESAQKINMSRLELKKYFTDAEIQGVYRRVEDAKQRRS